MPQETQNKAEYIVIFISEFARRFGLSAVQAYRYLNRYKAIDFLDEQYNIAHTQSFEDMVQNMAGYCQRHGGLMDSATGLYFQSPVYIYSYLDRELATGKM